MQSKQIGFAVLLATVCTLGCEQKPTETQSVELSTVRLQFSTFTKSKSGAT